MASLVFAWMEQEHGKDAALRMLRGYGEGRSTEALVREVLGTDLGGFDDAVDRYIRTRFADAFRAVQAFPDAPERDAPLDEFRAAARRHPESFPLRLMLGRKLFEADRPDEAEAELKEALRLFPGYAELDGPFYYLAEIHRERGENELAANALTQLGLLNENALEAHLLEAELREGLGDRSGAAQALERSFLIHPYEAEAHARLAELQTVLGNHDAAVRERRAVVALNPVDLADAQYRLARTLVAAGRRDEARREVLRALEIAPGYAAAQDLLLELRGGGR
jgi:tetratricopeptide (TPR) repeat protein